jgi:hypothetical protein
MVQGNIADGNRHLAEDLTKTQPLEDFWNSFPSPGAASSLVDGTASASSNSPSRGSAHSKSPGRSRAKSSASAVATPGQRLSAHHPALSLPALLDTFGPLVFPIYKAALLRKRILLTNQAPVELACNFGIYL